MRDTLYSGEVLLAEKNAPFSYGSVVIIDNVKQAEKNGRPVYDEDGQRLPATYANFLIVNGAVLMPTYGQPANDELARRALLKAFPQHEIVGIDCRSLIRQHGSLHCCTMQFPASVLQ